MSTEFNVFQLWFTLIYFNRFVILVLSSSHENQESHNNEYCFGCYSRNRYVFAILIFCNILKFVYTYFVLELSDIITVIA